MPVLGCVAVVTYALLCYLSYKHFATFNRAALGPELGRGPSWSQNVGTLLGCKGEGRGDDRAHRS